jgi:hypothetical protein
LNPVTTIGCAARAFPRLKGGTSFQPFCQQHKSEAETKKRYNPCGTRVRHNACCVNVYGILSVSLLHVRGVKSETVINNPRKSSEERLVERTNKNS